QAFVRNVYGKASVSQRDLQRVFQLLEFFFIQKRTFKEHQVFGKLTDFRLIQHCVVLALAMVYYFRLDTEHNGRNARAEFAERIDKHLRYKSSYLL
ncbi:MAG TPA: hypothetical protein VIL29_00125, partial [Pseudothermotoga sp.]